MIGNLRVRLKDVRSNLVAPPDLRLLRFHLVLRRIAQLDLTLIECRAQHLHRRGLVLELTALVLTGDDDACRLVGNTDCRTRLVDMLATRARRAVHVDTQVLLLYLDIDRIVHHWIDEYARERRVAAA